MKNKLKTRGLEAWLKWESTYQQAGTLNSNPSTTKKDNVKWGL
jgi:hypothetical protein